MSRQKKIFISYRRADVEEVKDSDGDTAPEILKEHLEDNYTVFLDRKLVGGDEWEEVLEREVTSADLVLVLIGPRWLSILQERQHMEETDWVLREVNLALEHNRRIFPILFGDASHPQREDLPEEIKRLSKKQSTRLNIERPRPCKREIDECINRRLTAIHESDEDGLAIHHLCLPLKYTPDLGLALKRPKFIWCDRRGDSSVSEEEIATLNQALERVWRDGFQDPIPFSDSKTFKSAVERRVAHLAFESSEVIETAFTGIKCYYDVALSIIINDDDLEDDFEASDPQILNLDFRHCKWMLGRRKSVTPNRLFASVTTVWKYLAEQPFHRKRTVRDPNFASREQSVIYTCSQAFKNNHNENPNAVFGEVNEDEIADSLAEHEPLGTICVVRRHCQETDVNIDHLCKEVFKEITELPINECMCKISALLKERSFYGQIILHDPALLEYQPWSS